MSMALPTSIVPVRFTDESNETFEGLFIPKELLFYIGFDEGGSFRFPFEIISWEELSDEYIKENGITWEEYVQP